MSDKTRKDERTKLYTYVFLNIARNAPALRSIVVISGINYIKYF